MLTAEMLTVEDKDHCLKVFNMLDEDHTGFISLANLKKVAKEIGETMSEPELQNLIKKIDTDGDGEISFAEFYAVIAKQRG